MRSPSAAVLVRSWRARVASRLRSATTDDCRARQLEQALVKGLLASGIEAVRIGRGPTPMLYYASTTLKTDGAVMVTGSHNPPDYNGFKMMLGGKPFFGDEIRDLGEHGRGRRRGGGDARAASGHRHRAGYVARLRADWDGGDRC